MSSPCIVVLAAGLGRRLGLGPKALLTLEGETLAARAVRAASAAGGRPLLVLGPRADEIAASVRPPDREVEPVVLRVTGWEEGMSRAWRAGVGRALQLEPGLPVAIVLVDQPGVGPDVISRLLSAHRPGRITRAAYQGRPGHPVVLDPDHAAAAARQAHGDTGAREYLQAHPESIDTVECADLGSDDDIDVAADLARWPGLG
ncbi:NTP transferase domain-containing protein [Sinomonas atrocyanea]|uniref:nucleotidyltransferase family protein n=1 Tax=Sinomonas atrocyanea TaxID=37927 RepID=UPI0027848A53|nr:NTP transferase domain-containing protein [Sinomonas atrocyanea]MDQ0258876.1 nicotine blue oxidoreductase [Sinomonas atrocyanea]MDR6622017.1 nicotine blue oxidoreductase [Sinomonas atrocyanea]